MAWTDIFRSRYVRFLEAELERIKTAHADELNRAIQENNRAWGEADRLRQYLLPGMPVADRNPQANEPAAVEAAEPHGTPFQRLLRKSYLEQEAAAKAEAEKKPATPPVQPV